MNSTVGNLKQFCRRQLRQFAVVRGARSFVKELAWRTRYATRGLSIVSDRLRRGAASLARGKKSRGSSDADINWLKQSYRLMSFAEFVVAGKSKGQTILLDAEQRVYPSPVLLGARSVAAEVTSVTTPAVRAVSIDDAIVVGRCDVVFVGGDAVYADQLEPHRDLYAEEVHGVAKVRLGDRTMRIALSYRVSSRPVASAVSLLGGATRNYVHWLTETLPKLALLDRAPEFHDLPLLVDDELHPNLYEALDVFNVHRREVIKVSPRQSVMVRRLVCITPPSYVPFDYRAATVGATPTIQAQDIQFSPTGVAAVQAGAAQLIANENKAKGRKLYLRRNSAYRRVMNGPAVEAVLAAAGFETVEPERLDFYGQLKLFRSAGTIVAQGGAALGNICLAPPGCRVLALVADSDHVNYQYFSNLAAILRHELRYVVGKGRPRSGDHASHGDFEIDPVLLRSSLTNVPRAA